MSSNSSKLIPLVFFFLLHFASSNAFNITNLLNNYTDYSTFNQYLSQTRVADAINNRQTITVLVVNNGKMGEVADLQSNTLKSLLSLHVILEYVDDQKIKNMKGKSGLVSTLYQASGMATGQRGFLNMSVSDNGDVAFGSPASGTWTNSKVVKNVISQPYNVTVLEISSLINPSELDGAPSSAPSLAPSKKGKKSPASSPEPAHSPSASSPDSPPSPTADGPSGKSGSAALGSGVFKSAAFAVVLGSIWFCVGMIW